MDRTPSAHWPAPQLTFTPDASDGPVLVTLTYQVSENNAVAFTEAMRHVGPSGPRRWPTSSRCLRRSRSRSGNTGQAPERRPAIVAVPGCQFRCGTTQIEPTGDDRWTLGRPRQMPARVPFSRKIAPRSSDSANANEHGRIKDAPPTDDRPTSGFGLVQGPDSDEGKPCSNPLPICPAI